MAAHLSLKKKKAVSHNKGGHTHNKHTNCQHKLNYFYLKKELKGIATLLDRFPYIRGRFFYMKKHFNKILKKNNAMQKEKILTKIQEMEEKNPSVLENGK